MRTLVEVPDIDGIVAGFPCVDISQAGLQSGLAGLHSSLVFVVFRICDMKRARFIFFENVAALLRLPQVWKSILAELLEREIFMLLG